MLTNERQDMLLELLLVQGHISLADASAQLGVSEMTIRRDMEVLEETGLVHRVRGGAMLAPQSSFEVTFMRREMLHRALKRRIGLAAAALIADDDMIAMDGSTTTLYVARNLRHMEGLRVVTNGVKIATELGNLPGIQLLLTGGLLRDSISLVGAFATETAERTHADKFIFSVAGIDLAAGLTDGNVPDAEVKRAFMDNSSQHIVVAASPKFGRRSFVSLCRLDEVHTVVTDDGIAPEMAAALRERGIQLVIARTEPESAAAEEGIAAAQT